MIAELSHAQQAWLDEAEVIDVAPTPAPMTLDEARTATESIRSGLVTLRQLFLDVYERDGWKALGYASFVEYAEREFDYGKSHAYRLIDAATVERNLRFSPMGEKEIVPERVLRPLAKLEPDQQVAAYAKAVYMSPNGKPTEAHTTKAAAEYTRPATPKPIPTKPTYVAPQPTPAAGVPVPTPPPPPVDDAPSADELEAMRMVAAEQADEDQERAQRDAQRAAFERVAEPTNGSMFAPEWIVHVLTHYDPANADYPLALGMATLEQLREALELVPPDYANATFRRRRFAIKARIDVLGEELAEAVAPKPDADPRLSKAMALRDQLVATRTAVNADYSTLCGKWVEVLGWYRGCEKMIADLDALIETLGGAE